MYYSRDNFYTTLSEKLTVSLASEIEKAEPAEVSEKKLFHKHEYARENIFLTLSQAKKKTHSFQ